MGPATLPQGLLDHGRLEVCDQISMFPESKSQFAEVLYRDTPEFVETLRRRLAHELIGNVSQCGAPPEVQALLEEVPRQLGVSCHLTLAP